MQLYATSKQIELGFFTSCTAWFHCEVGSTKDSPIHVHGLVDNYFWQTEHCRDWWAAVNTDIYRKKAKRPSGSAA